MTVPAGNVLTHKLAPKNRCKFFTLTKTKIFVKVFQKVIFFNQSTMNKLIISSILLFSSFAFSQVAIGKTAVTNTSVSLEFETTEARGLLLPWATSAASVTGAVNGTLIFDTTDKKVKVKYATGWKDLSGDNTGVVDTSLQDPLSENTTAKVSIGPPTSTPGILVLEDTNKAMILPKVNSYADIINPAAGMMVYVRSAKQLAVFNGTVWSFWKP
jgi:hypothetical protein